MRHFLIAYRELFDGFGYPGAEYDKVQIEEIRLHHVTNDQEVIEYARSKEVHKKFCYSAGDYALDKSIQRIFEISRELSIDQ